MAQYTEPLTKERFMAIHHIGQPPTTVRLVEPSACRWCGIPRRQHMQQWKEPVGWHKWEHPTDGQIKQRMLARRHVRLTAPAPAYHAATHWTGSATDPEDPGDAICADCRTPDCAQYERIQRRLDRARWRDAALHGWTADASGWGPEQTPF